MAVLSTPIPEKRHAATLPVCFRITTRTRLSGRRSFTIAIIVVTIAIWLFVQGAGTPLALAQSVCKLGLIPGELTMSLPPGTPFPMGEGLVCLTDPGRQLTNLLTSMFLHGSWMHLLGNMWFLWLFGNNIEDSMTRPRFLAFYLLTGLAAAFAQVLADPASEIPMVGRLGRDQRRDGRVPRALPARARLHDGAARLHPAVDSRCPHG